MEDEINIYLKKNMYKYINWKMRFTTCHWAHCNFYHKTFEKNLDLRISDLL